MTALQQLKAILTNERLMGLINLADYLDTCLEKDTKYLQEKGRHYDEIYNFSNAAEDEPLWLPFSNAAYKKFAENYIIPVVEKDIYSFVTQLSNYEPKCYIGWINCLENGSKLTREDRNMHIRYEKENELAEFICQQMKAFKPVLEQEIKALLKKENIPITD